MRRDNGSNVPSPPDDEELAACLRVLESIVEDRGRLAGLPEEMRNRLVRAAGMVARPDTIARKRLAMTYRRSELATKREHDLKLLDAAGNRATRRKVSHIQPGSTGHALDLPDLTPLLGDGSGEPTTDPATPGLLASRSCYVCKQRFVQVHHFYDSLCPPCADLNFAKRFQTARLDGRVAIVTGARIKIGFQAALMLLRAGARVIVTSRFPVDAAERYSKEPDFDAWKDRLEVHALDLRHLGAVERLGRHLAQTLPRLDILIHNAAQTVRRPPAYYASLAEAEERTLAGLDARVRPLLPNTTAGLVAMQHEGSLALPSRLSQIALMPGDDAGAEHFPPGALDLDEQQIDLRDKNSWRMKLADVPTIELVEVHVVNAVAPFVLTRELRALLARDRTDEKHVINVSAMEASYARRKKTDKHPHTNMAKAALNMMTRTSAEDFIGDGIHMNSVDTGWVTDEDPLHHVERKQRIHDFHPPLDAIDGAARVCDPLFDGLLRGDHAWGRFFKDYKPVAW